MKVKIKGYLPTYSFSEDIMTDTCNIDLTVQIELPIDRDGRKKLKKKFKKIKKLLLSCQAITLTIDG